MAAPLKLPTTGSGLTLLPTSLANQGASLIPTSLATGGAQLIPGNTAATLAGTQYNQAIADAQASLQATQAGAAQSLGNVGNWWDSITGAQSDSSARSAALGQAIAGAEGGSNASILASLGGSANPGASSIASAGQNNLGTLQAINQVNGNYNADMAPILQLGAAGAKGQQQTAGNNAIQLARQNIQDLTAQKGATQAQDQYQIMQDNNSIRDAQQTRLLSILSGNNTIKDNRVSNLASIVGANNTTIGAQQSHNLDVLGYQLNKQQLGDQEKQFTASQASDFRNYKLQLRGVNDSEQQNQLATIMALGVDPTTGTLEPAAAKAIGQLTGLDPKALMGTNASTASKIITSNNSATAKVLVQADKDALPNAALSGKYGAIVDGQGNYIPNANGGGIQPIAGWKVDSAGTGVVKIPTTTANGGHASGTLTSDEATNIVDGWHTGKSVTTSVHNGTDSNGNANIDNVTKQEDVLTYGQALAKAKGYDNPAERAGLIAKVNSTWSRGEGGRPWLDAQQTALLAKTGPQVNPKTGAVTGGPGRGAGLTMINGHAVLDKSQYAALKAAHKLPGGQLTSDGFYVIDPSG